MKRAVAVLLILSSAWSAHADEPAQFIDHSLLVDENYPCTWPAAPFPRFHLIHEQKIGPSSVYNIDALLIDGNTGTQYDVPPHSVARPDLNRPKSGPYGLAYTDKIEPWQFGGEACVVDVRALLDQAPNGVSPLVTPEHVQAFEKAHRNLRFGDTVLFRSDYSDKYYRPLPEGSRFIADAVDRKTPGYPDPNPECMEYLATRGVMSLGTDSASMGPLPELAEPTHYAGLKHGMIWTESATNLGAIPSTGAFYCLLSPRHANGPYAEARTFSIVGQPAARLIESARHKRAVDLSPTLAPDLPITHPGIGTGNHRQAYLKVDFLYSDYLDMWHHTHWMDAMAGTHLVPPAFALPAPGETPDYAPEVRGWVQEYEQQYGPLGRSDRTTEKVPLDWTCGELRVIDVRALKCDFGEQQPASPEITEKFIQDFEVSHGKLQPHEIILFRTDHVATHLKKSPDDKGMWSDPLSGKAPGWAAPGPQAIRYLKSKGIRCIATDAPDLGGVDPKRAAMTYWALGSNDVVGVEFLENAKQLPEKSYFTFAAIKIRGCHGGPGRAIAWH